MRLSVSHTTRYRFDGPVPHALQRLRLTPKQTQGQEILSWEMQYENAVEQLSYEDQHHNTVTVIAAEPGAEELVITCAGEVDTHDHAGVIGRHSGHMPLWSFGAQTILTQPGPKARALARQIGGTDSPTLDKLHELSRLVSAEVEYQVGTTNVTTTAEEALEAGSGVCQDHAHIFIGVARLLDIPARYVSGYLMMNDRIDQDATHAWAEAHIDGLGWVGFDVSNGISPDPRYVRVATGLDYAEAAPISGVTIGSGNTVLDVAVSVEQRALQQ